MEKDENLEVISEILHGVSIRKTSFGLVYFKHISQIDQREILSKSSIIRSDAKEKGLLFEKEALGDLIDQDMWSDEQEQEIQKISKEIESIKNVIGQLNLPSKRKKAEKHLIKLEKKLNEINLEKQNLLGLTIEKFVSNKLQRLTIEKVLFYDKNLKESVYENLYANDRSKEIEVFEIQKQFFDKFSDKKISVAALSNYFSLYMPYCEDPFGVFGKPLKDLTSYQLKLISMGRYYLSIFKNCSKKIPENIAKDPDLLISFYESSREDKKSTNASSGSGGSTHFGATKSDIETIKKEDESVVDLSDEIKKEGGHLNMEQLMKLHGV